jgi:hypothetical protein
MNAPLPIERHGFELVTALRGIAASTSRSASLDRAIASMGPIAKAKRIASIKAGARIIIAEAWRLGASSPTRPATSTATSA